ncbi:MAG: flavin reductase, partial [Lachnospiraceae bacterium]
DAEVLDDAVPMTYAYYHTVKKGMTPPKASSYNPEPAKGYRCKICGYVLESTTIPEDFICPICGRGKEELETIVK